jgi:excisionase family DNA binding protein
MTVKQAAARLSLHPWSVYELVKSGALPCRRVGPRAGKIVLDEQDVERYWREAKVRARPAGVEGALDRH